MEKNTQKLRLKQQFLLPALVTLATASTVATMLEIPSSEMQAQAATTQQPEKELWGYIAHASWDSEQDYIGPATDEKSGIDEIARLFKTYARNHVIIPGENVAVEMKLYDQDWVLQETINCRYVTAIEKILTGTDDKQASPSNSMKCQIREADPEQTVYASIPGVNQS